MLLACTHDGPQPRHRKVGRCVGKALQLGALAALQDPPRCPAQIPRASLDCRAGLSKTERLGLELRTMKLLSHSVAKSICRSWPRGRHGKFFLNRRSAFTKYRTNDGIQNGKMAEIPLFYKQLLHEQETDTPLAACIPHDEKPGAIGKAAPGLPPVPGHCPRSRLRVQTPWNGYGGPGDRTPVRSSTGTEVGSSLPFSINQTPATLPQPNFGWDNRAHGNAGLRPTGSSSCSRRSTS